MASKSKKQSAPVHQALALVTGASTGIGRAISEELAQRGYSLVLVARSLTGLNQAADEIRSQHGVHVDVIAKDLSKPEAAPELAKELAAHKLSIDVLVNNAGMADLNDFLVGDRDAQMRLVDLNVRSLTDLCRTLIPGMVKRKYGRVLNVSSTSAFQPLPGFAVYAASKVFVLSFSEAIAAELSGTGVTVTALCPGVVETPLLEKVSMKDKYNRKLFPIMQASDVARIGVDAMLKGKRVVVPGVLNRFGAITTARLPRGWAPRGIRLAQKLAGK